MFSVEFYFVYDSFNFIYFNEGFIVIVIVYVVNSILFSCIRKE